MRDHIAHSVEVQTHAMGSIARGVATIGSPDDKMLDFEMGSATQPPRSVLGGALIRKSKEVAELLGQQAHASLIGRGAITVNLPLP